MDQQPTSAAASDALALLKADHEQVLALFREFDTLRGSDEEDEHKAFLVDEICFQLTVHGMLEEEIFYPMLRAAIDDDELLDEADVEHAGARDLISQLEVMFPGDDHFDATVTVLGEEIAHHIEKEEADLFQAARKAGLDLDELAHQLQARRDELDEDLNAPPAAIETLPLHPPRRGQRPPN